MEQRRKGETNIRYITHTKKNRGIRTCQIRLHLQITGVSGRSRL